MNITTKTSQKIQDYLEQLDPNTTRYQVLLNAKKFKSNWQDLGRLLYDLSKSNEFKEWGYSNLEDYSQKELKIKKETLQKLLMSFGYIKKHCPEIIDQNSIQNIPDFRVVDQLARVEEQDFLNKEDIETLREQVFSKPMSTGTLKKHIEKLNPESDEIKEEKGQELLCKKMEEALKTLKKVLPVFNPSENVDNSLTIIEKFISELKDESINS